MLVGQQIGPFLIEKEIGAGAMGAVYRGKYVKTGQLVAIKVMAPGLGTTSASHSARFERESAVLKQLNHPNVVRLFGVGKHQGTPYFAMEYVQGESLDKVMARRDRMTWEEVIDLGQQLCAALQHAHEHGIVHRDLKPSNLMILPDGTLKLTDFGIAKDLDVTALTGANCTVGTAAYMSPEQCKGDPNIGPKSDLYSLGVVLYELVTGKKPFNAENAMDMFLLHVNEEPVRPSRLALDMPPWLDTLILQLLEKKPEQRPLDAATVGQALASIQEKVESQQSAGAEAVKSRMMDRPRGLRKVADEDREAARSLMGKKAGKRRKPARKGMSGLLIAMQAGGILLALGGVVVVLVVMFRPASADKLYDQAEMLWTSGDKAKQEKAREGPIAEYLRRFADVDNEKTRQIRAWRDEYDARGFEDLMERYVKRETTGVGLKITGKTDGETLAFKAALAEHEGNRDEAVSLWNEVVKKEGTSRVGLTATAHLRQLALIDTTEQTFAARRRAMRDSRAEPAGLDDYDQRAFLAWRQELLGDREGAKVAYANLRESADKGGKRFWTLLAASKERRLKELLKKDPQDKEARQKAVNEVVAAAEAEVKMPKLARLDVRLPLQDVVAVYDKDADMADAVKKAKALIAAIDKGLAGGK
jgi:eukaryotic-like serine/threonine-protein kinase